VPRPRTELFTRPARRGTAVGFGLCVDALGRAALSASLPFDLNFWSEDYFMTSMLRLARGAPVYGPLGEASSSIYAPGGPWLHHALLAPLGLSTSVLANRLLSQLWQLGAVALGVLAVIAIAKRSSVWPKARSARFASAALVTSALLLSVYANPVATSLHPVAWETCACRAVLLVDWDCCSLRVRVLAAAACWRSISRQAAGSPRSRSRWRLPAARLTSRGPRAPRSCSRLRRSRYRAGLCTSARRRFTLWGSRPPRFRREQDRRCLRTIAPWWLPPRSP
jgi:hypothetical protein